MQPLAGRLKSALYMSSIWAPEIKLTNRRKKYGFQSDCC
nr:MAG TPA: hypothetical protein [Caudoviricetes sp.]